MCFRSPTTTSCLSSCLLGSIRAVECQWTTVIPECSGTEYRGFVSDGTRSRSWVKMFYHLLPVAFYRHSSRMESVALHGASWKLCRPFRHLIRWTRLGICVNSLTSQQRRLLIQSRRMSLSDPNWRIHSAGHLWRSSRTLMPPLNDVRDPLPAMLVTIQAVSRAREAREVFEMWSVRAGTWMPTTGTVGKRQLQPRNRGRCIRIGVRDYGLSLCISSEIT